MIWYVQHGDFILDFENVYESFHLLLFHGSYVFLDISFFTRKSLILHPIWTKNHYAMMSKWWTHPNQIDQCVNCQRDVSTVAFFFCLFWVICSCNDVVDVCLLVSEKQVAGLLCRLLMQKIMDKPGRQMEWINALKCMWLRSGTTGVP